jgi:manganese oxidase
VTELIRMRVGERVRNRFIGSNHSFVDPMHIHGGPFTIVETDGTTVPATARVEKDTINVGPGERYDVIWTVREPGK